jgi:hypothetical protein
METRPQLAGFCFRGVQKSPGSAVKSDPAGNLNIEDEILILNE